MRYLNKRRNVCARATKSKIPIRIYASSLSLSLSPPLPPSWWLRSDQLSIVHVSCFACFADFIVWVWAESAVRAMSVALGLGGSQEIHDIARTFEIDRSVNNKCIPHLIDVVRQRRSYVDVYYCYYLLLHIAREIVCVSSLCRLCAVLCVCTRFFRYSFLMSESSRASRAMLSTHSFDLCVQIPISITVCYYLLYTN